MLHVIQVRSHWGKDIYNEIGCLRKSSNDSKNISPQELRIWVLRQNSKPAWKPRSSNIVGAGEEEREDKTVSLTASQTNFPGELAGGWRSGAVALSVTASLPVWGLSHVLIHFSWVPALHQSTSPRRATSDRTEQSEGKQKEWLAGSEGTRSRLSQWWVRISIGLPHPPPAK